MTDILERLRTSWPATYALQPVSPTERRNVIEIQKLKADAADEIERLRAMLIIGAFLK